MQLRLDSALADRFAHTARVLLSPMEFADVDAWRLEAGRAFRRMFDGDHALFQLPGQDRLYVGDGVDASTIRALTASLDAATPDEFRYRDGDLQRLYRRRRRQADGVFTRARNERMLGVRMRDTALYNDVCLPAGMVEFQGLYSVSPFGDAMLWVSRDRSTDAFGEAAVPLLRALAPVFDAGIGVLARRTASASAGDTSGAAIPAAGVRLPPATALRRRFGLTPRQAEVALHLARGESEKRIAAALGISRHTARHHTERVFDKLDVHARGEVALRILRAD